MDLRILGWLPDTQEVADALEVVAEALAKDVCYALDARFHFMVEGDWSIAVSADSAGRIRVESCRLSIPRSAMWVLADNHERLAGLVVRMRSHVLEPRLAGRPL